MERPNIGIMLLVAGVQAATALRRSVPQPLRRLGLGGTGPLPRRSVAALALVVVLAAGAAWELRTASLEARLLSRLASNLSYRVEPGPSHRIVFPAGGPQDRRRGYSRLPEFTRRLEARGFQVEAQARHSPAMAVTTRLGISPPYLEPSAAGLVVEGMDGEAIYEAMAGRPGFKRFEDVPPFVTRTLLYIENRELDRNRSPYSNPAVDWSRFGKALLLYSASRVGLPLSIEGGSTLAVQLEKYRHFPGGRTSSGVDKLRQMLSASLRAYRDGPVTTEARRRIVVDYLNTMPLAGAARYGEVTGLEEGLRVWFGVKPDREYRRLESRSPQVRARAMKRILALLCAVRAPSRYLLADRSALEARVNAYAALLAREGILDRSVVRAMIRQRLRFGSSPGRAAAALAVRPGRDARRVRDELVGLLALRDTYELDRLHLNVETTIHPSLQRKVSSILRQLGDTAFVAAHGLRGERLLGRGDPRRVIYSFLLCERTPEGDFVRVHADNLDRPFDVNEGMMMELGSTAKLRTLVHYLDLVSRLYTEFAPLGPEDLEARAREARDPITAWTAGVLLEEPEIDRERLLERALDRTYPASPYELFYTGAGFHTFRNYDPDDNGTILPVREAFARSTNMVFIRLMRDLVRYHAARLPYDTRVILEEPHSPERSAMLHEVADEEGDPESMRWLFRTRRREAQDNRLRAKIERDAFARMLPYWRQLGFPFSRLVPSYATAIGSSGDRPSALAELMGILMNDGVRSEPRLVRRLRFGEGTPYETAFESQPTVGETVLEPAVARVARRALGQVVESGTAARLRSAFDDSTGTVWIGGKTGTGDNRYESFGKGRRLLGSRPVSRTAAFTFALGDRYYGVLTAAVLGAESGRYRFTSSLPLKVMDLLVPTLKRELRPRGAPEGAGGRLVAGEPASTDDPVLVGGDASRAHMETDGDARGGETGTGSSSSPDSPSSEREVDKPRLPGRPVDPSGRREPLPQYDL